MLRDLIKLKETQAIACYVKIEILFTKIKEEIAFELEYNKLHSNVY